jgi:hypothetical protein
MHFIRNWPEGLFILPVFGIPAGLFLWLLPASAVGRTLSILGGAIAGVALWIAIVFAAANVYDRKTTRRKNSQV